MSVSTPIAPPATLQTTLRPAMQAGVYGSLILLLILVVWAQFTLISGAVIAMGQVLVRGNAKLVQNLDGGVVAEILVRNGDKVAEGQVLMRLDPTLLKVNLDIARNRLAEAITEKARLEAEQLGLPTIDFVGMDASDAALHLGGLSLTRQKIGQTQIFSARREVLKGTVDQLRTRIDQIGIQRTGMESGIKAKQDQLSFVEKELEDVVALNKQGLARQSQVLDLQRSQSEMLSTIADDQSQIAGMANSIRDTELQIAHEQRTFQEEVVTRLREVTTTSEELILQIVNTRKQLDRVEMRSPANGVIHEMQVATVGGVVAPGATVLQVVPLDEGLQFEFRLDPRSVDQVRVGQSSKIRFPAFSSQSTPDLEGKLASVSPTSINDPATGQSYYKLEIDIAPEELARLGASELVPGMPVEAFLQSGDRSVLSYLVKPLSDQISRAFRDE